MERKAGFIECPKCGLRNKPNTVQCDFCGQSLTSPDEWQLQVKDLESLTKVEYRRPVDEPTSRRIEATFIRKEQPHQKAVEIRELGNLEKIFKDLEDVAPAAKPKIVLPEVRPHIEEVKAPVQSAMPVMTKIEKEPDEVKVPVRTEPEMVIVASIEQEKVEEQVIVQPIEEVAVGGSAGPEPVMERPISTETLEQRPAAQAEQVDVQGAEAPKTTAEPVKVERKLTIPPKTGPIRIAAHPRMVLKKRKGMAVALVAVGVLLYVLALALSYLGTFDDWAGIGSGAISSILIIFGAVNLYPMMAKGDSSMVFICPKCHETVGKDQDSCPACGAQFSCEE
jgi:hypothetical protein